MSVYSIDGRALIEETGFRALIRYWYKRDDETGAFYTLVHIPQTDHEGNKQYPFVIWPNYPNGGIQSTLQMNRAKKYLAAVNAGRFASPYGPGVTLTGKPLGTVIQNSVVLQQGASGNYSPGADMVLTIDRNGELGYALCEASAADLVANGIVSAVSGFVPILINYQNIQDVEPSFDYYNTSDSQRQIIGQYYNGDYVIISTEGRGNQGEGFFTFVQLQALCKSYGLKHAFLLDGGGSTETVVGTKQLNPFYDNTLGRVVATYVVFNGTTTFGEPG